MSYFIEVKLSEKPYMYTFSYITLLINYVASLNNTLHKPSRNKLEFGRDSSKPVRKKNFPYFIYHS